MEMMSKKQKLEIDAKLRKTLSISPEMTIRQVLSIWPETWVVFDRHSLPDDVWLDADVPAPPDLRLSIFARTHGVRTPDLIMELQGVAR